MCILGTTKRKQAPNIKSGITIAIIMAIIMPIPIYLLLVNFIK